jgi:Phosphate-selective porin O and P
LRDAYIAFHVIKNQEIRVGQQKTLFGYENTQSITELYVVNRSDVSDNLARGFTLRDIGLGLLGNIPLNKNFRLEDAGTFTNGAKMNVAGPFDFSNTKAGWGRIDVRYKKDNLMIRLGGSAGTGGIKDLGNNLANPKDDIEIKYKRFGTDLEIEHKLFSLAAEYIKGSNHEKHNFYHTSGYYAILAGKTKWKIGPLIRYESTDDEFKQVTAGAYYGLPKDKFRILVNYQFRKKITDIPEGHDDRLYIQMQVVF